MHPVFRNSSGRGLIDTIFTIAVILILFGIFAGACFTDLNRAREAALENQLTNLRYSLDLYVMLEGSYPGGLRELNRRCILLKEDSLYGKEVFRVPRSG